MPTCLAVVFWDPDQWETRAAITVHEVEDPPDPSLLKRDRGLAVTEFLFQENVRGGMATEDFMEAFPGYVVPVLDDEGVRCQNLPMGGCELQGLATMVGKPIQTFVHFRGQDSAPRPCERAEPAAAS